MNRKKILTIDYLICAVISVCILAVYFSLFYNQAIHAYVSDLTRYPCDMLAYIQEMLGQESGYEFPYPIYFKFGKLFYLCGMDECLAMAVATTIMSYLSFPAIKWALDSFLADVYEKSGKWELLHRIVVDLLTLSLLFVSMLYKPGTKDYVYKGVFTPNPYHNATYMVARAFTIVAFVLFVRLLDEYEEKINLRTMAAFSIALLLATMTKPSFTIVFGMAVGVTFIYKLIGSKGKNFKNTCIFALFFIPTVLDLLYQYSGVFTSSASAEESGMGIGFLKVWSTHTGSVPKAIIMASAFAFVVFVLWIREFRKDTNFVFSWIMYLCAVFTAAFLYEKGFRMKHFNFCWGYMCGLFFLYIGCIPALFRATIQPNRKKTDIIKVILCWMAFAAHLLCGIFYFIRVFNGQMYY